MRAGIPDLRRAAYRGHAEIFDVRDGHDRAAIARAQAVSGAQRLPRLAGQPAQSGAALRCGRGPLHSAAQVAAGIRAAAATAQ